MATAKQLAALKKARAARKRNLAAAKKKNPAKRTARKRVGTSKTKKSMATKKTPSKRLKKRRAKNTRKGYYPNPSPRYLVQLKTLAGKQIGYYAGAGKWDTLKSRAKALTKSGAEKIAMDTFNKHVRAIDWIKVIKK